MNLGLGAQSGWGKSWQTQRLTEQNAPEYDHLAVLDFKDEYRGLVKSGLARWWIGGPDEAAWSPGLWRQLLESNERLVVARHDGLDVDAWRGLANSLVAGARRLDGSTLVVIDEAHFVAPQTGKTPDAVKGLATTGRGEGVSSMWVTQRLAEMEETVIAQWQARLLGGFESSADLNKLGRIVEYPVEVHKPSADLGVNLPDELRADGQSLSLRKFENDDGHTTGSEWIYSDNSGDRRRIDTSQLSMKSTHYGSQGQKIEV